MSGCHCFDRIILGCPIPPLREKKQRLLGVLRAPITIPGRPGSAALIKKSMALTGWRWLGSLVRPCRDIFLLLYLLKSEKIGFP
jgi:hypothetical protein